MILIFLNFFQNELECENSVTVHQNHFAKMAGNSPNNFCRWRTCEKISDKWNHLTAIIVFCNHIVHDCEHLQNFAQKYIASKFLSEVSLSCERLPFARWLHFLPEKQPRPSEYLSSNLYRCSVPGGIALALPNSSRPIAGCLTSLHSKPLPWKPALHSQPYNPTKRSSGHH